MILLITAVCPKGKSRKISCCFSGIEDALCFLRHFNDLVDQVTAADIVDSSGRHFFVPLEVLS